LKQKPAGITILLKEPRALNAQVLAEQLSSVTGGPVRTQRGEGDFVSGGPKHYMVSLGGMVFTIGNWGTAYFDNPAAASQAFSDPWLKKAIREHRAWLSMDVVSSHISPEAYRMIARVVAKWMDAGCLALYHAPLDKFVACQGEETVEALLSNDPIGALFVAED
jgi:hypothetical protein